RGWLAVREHFAVSYCNDGTIHPELPSFPTRRSSDLRDLYGNLVTGFTGTVDVSSNKTCSAGCVQSAAFSAGVLASHSVTLTQAGPGARTSVNSNHAAFRHAVSCQTNKFSVSDAALER